MRVTLRSKGVTKKDITFEVDQIRCDAEGFHFWLHEDPKTEHFVTFSEMLCYGFTYEVVESGKH